MRDYEMGHAPSYCPFCGMDGEPSTSWFENNAPWFYCSICQKEFKYQKGVIPNYEIYTP